jgi:hypothetical protein
MVSNRTIRWWLRAFGIGGLLAGSFIVNSSPALAACHQFRVTASPSSVAEGAKVVVTVSRDGHQLPSSIHLSTINETAKAGTDYVGINQTVSFTTDVEKKITLSTLNDHLTEPSQTFRLHLSNPSGCLGAGYDVGPDVRVTIKDNDVKSTPSPTVGPPSPTPTPSVTPSPSLSSTVTLSTSPTPSPSSSESGVAAAASSDSGGGSVLPWIGGVLIILAAIGTFVLRRHRTNP